MSFHISELKKFNRCHKLFWYSLREEKQPFQPYARLDEKITELACQKLKIQDFFLGQKGDDSDTTLSKLNEYEWIVKGRFEYEGLRVKIPIMHKLSDNLVDLIFVYVGNYPREDDSIYYSANVWVLQKCGLKVNEIRILHLNADYIRGDELDIDELFVDSYTFYNDKGVPTKDITDYILNKPVDLSAQLQSMKEVSELDEFESVYTKKCVRRVKCPFFDTCFPEQETLEDDSILTLVSSQHKHNMLKEGIKLLKDADADQIEGSRQQYAQIMASKNGGLFVDKFPLRSWLDTIVKYPIAFVDFEWDTYAVPPYHGLKPFSVVCFEYSVHVMKEDGSITHQDFIGTKDCREDFIKNFLHDVESANTIIAFNAEGAEKLRLTELGVQFPKYKKQLNRVIDKMIDLSYPFQAGLVYDVKMRGLYSLKVLLSVVGDGLSYDDLSIHHGMDAVFSWRQIDKDETQDRELLIEKLAEYCSLDTYSMIVIYKWLKEISEDNNENI